MKNLRSTPYGYINPVVYRIARFFGLLPALLLAANLGACSKPPVASEPKTYPDANRAAFLANCMNDTTDIPHCICALRIWELSLTLEQIGAAEQRLLAGLSAPDAYIIAQTQIESVCPR